MDMRPLTKGIVLLVSLGATSENVIAAGTARATYDGTNGVYQNIFDSNSQQRCLACHNSALGAGAPRSFAPVGVDFNSYALATSIPASWAGDPDGRNSYRAAQRAGVISGGMPPPGDLNLTERTLLLNWAPTNSVPYQNDAPYVSNASASPLARYSATINTNVSENGDESTFRIYYKRNIDGVYTQHNVTTTEEGDAGTDSDGDGNTKLISYAVTGLQCETLYNTYAWGDNSVNTTTSAVTSFTTSDCPDISTNIADFSISEDSNSGNLNITINDGTLAVTANSSNTGLVPNNVSALNFTDSSGTSRVLVITPTANQFGSATITITASDGTTSDTDTFVLTVNSVNDFPSITAISDQGTLEDTSTSALAVTVGDVETAAGSLTLTALSSDTGVVPTTNNCVMPTTPGICFGGAGSSRTVTLKPAVDAIGSTTITVRASDGTDFTDEPFLLTVTPVSDPPTISDSPNQSAVNEDNPVSVAAITVGDDLTAAGSLVLAGSSSNTTLVPNSNIVFGGSGASRTATITPAANQNGSTTITVTVWDGGGVGLGLSITDTFTVTFNAVNDSPTLTPISNQAVTELSPFGLTVTPSDVDDANDGSGALTFALGGQPSGMSINNLGVISYTPGQDTAAVFNVTVTVTDGGENSSTPAIQSFTLTVNKLDGDVDTIADYHDNCPATANTDQLNTDGDAQGNVCDADDDNDLIPDTVELAKGMNPLDAADAAGDLDGDGLTNLAEYQTCVANSDATCNAMLVDSVDPVITTNGDLIVPSTGYVTAGGETASASDGIDGDIPVTADIHGPYRPGRYVVTWTAEDAANNVATLDQQIDVLPLIQIDTNLLVGENNQVKVPVRMNGVAPTYPVDIQYTVSGSASGADHSAVNGTLSIASGDSGVIEFTTNADSASEADETVVITLSSVSTNAVLSSDKIATITIVDRQAPPNVALEVEQNAIVTQQLFSNSGTVTLRAIATDPNGGNLSYSWGETSNALAISVNNNIATFNPLALAAGSYHVAVAVSDGLVTVKRETTVTIAASAPTLSNVSDTDGDGVDDQTEGLADSDGDGVSDYRDPVNAVDLLNISNDDTSDRFDRLIETESGLRLSLGAQALAANHIGARISSVDIKDSTGNVISDSTFQLTGELFDFNVTGLNDVHKQAVIVIPLKTSILPDSVYRKFIGGSWRAFDANNGDTIATSPLVEGKCPALENAAAWTSGLHATHRCLRLSITDGGSNDADGSVNGAVADPGGLAVAKNKAEPTAPTRSQTGSGEIAWWTLLMMVALLSVRQLKRQTRSVRAWK